MNDYEKLKDAVRRYIDEFYQDDIDGSRIVWPGELARLIDWKEPDSDNT